MSYNEVWVGVFCEKCFQPILVYNDEVWKKLIATQIPGATGVICSHSGCSHRSDYRIEQFVRFRVEKIPS